MTRLFRDAIEDMSKNIRETASFITEYMIEINENMRKLVEKRKGE